MKSDKQSWAVPHHLPQLLECNLYIYWTTCLMPIGFKGESGRQLR